MQRGTLYLVATPIGNLADISERAAATLKGADLILCEDTRHSGKLLQQIGATARKLSFHDHNEEARTPQIINDLEHGKRIALISDAGMPTISDPGFKLVRACREAGIAVTPIPGATAAIAALSASGLPTDQFVFLGFPPESGGKRQRFLIANAKLPMTRLLYLSPHKAARQLADMAEAWGDIEAVLAREITKLHEEFIAGTLGELAEMLAEQKPKGELVLVVAGADPLPAAEDPAAVLTELKATGIGGRRLADALAARTELSRKQAYDLVLAAEEAEEE